MIEIGTEELLTLADAARDLPRRRLGRRPHVSTLHRWVTRGLRGTRLEAIQIGGHRCTSREALQRFFDQLGYVPLPTADLDGAEPGRPDDRAGPAACPPHSTGAPPAPELDTTHKWRSCAGKFGTAVPNYP